MPLFFKQQIATFALSSSREKLNVTLEVTGKLRCIYSEKGKITGKILEKKDLLFYDSVHKLLLEASLKYESERILKERGSRKNAKSSVVPSSTRASTSASSLNSKAAASGKSKKHPRD